VPAAYEAAVASRALHGLEHASFFAAGVVVWAVLLDAARSAGRRAAFAATVLVAGVPLAELMLATGPIYPHYEGLASRPFGLSAAEDQTRAGLMMMAEQIATLGTAAALLWRSHAERMLDQPVRG
jgi:putative membrane protein